MKFFRRLRALVRRQQLDADMSEEMRAHLELLTAEHERRGMNADEARFAARREFGGLEQIKERARDGRGWVGLEHLWQDLRHAWRGLARSPLFALVAVTSLAHGLGANLAMFGWFETMAWRPLPVAKPQELVQLGWQRTAKQGGPVADAGDEMEVNGSGGEPIRHLFSWTAFERMRAAVSGGEMLGWTRLEQPNLTIDGQSERVREGHLVSGNYHAVLGVKAAVGRTLRPDDDRPGAAPVVVISHRYWERRFARDPSIVGRNVVLNRTPVTIVGVTEPGFGGVTAGQSAPITAPLALAEQVWPEANEMSMRGAEFWWVRVMARVKPGVAAEQLRASLEGVFRDAAVLGWKNPDAPPRLHTSPGGYGRSERARHDQVAGLTPLALMAGLLLAVACANLANLLMARGLARRREFAVRLALGAGAFRLVRQLLAESFLLALLGAAAGLGLASWGIDLLFAHLAAPWQEVEEMALHVDWRVAGFGFTLALGTALAFGLVPALRAARLDLSTEFQGGARTLGGRGSRLGRGLMIAQVALSLVLLVLAGLLGRTVKNLRAVDIGFDREHLLLFSLSGVSAGYAEGPRLDAFYRLVADRLATLGGVRGVTYAQAAVMSHEQGSRVGFRGFSAQDRAGGRPVAVVNQALATKYFPGENPLGRHLVLRRGRNRGDLEIVGVVRDFRQRDLRTEVQPTIYTPLAQLPVREANFAVRTLGVPETMATEIRRLVAEIDPNVPLAYLRTQAQQVEWTMTDERLISRLATFLGSAAALLASVGLYGLLAYNVSRRTGEIGLRMALGALPAQVRWMILRESLALAGIGIACGLAGAWAASRLVTNWLYGLSPTDPATLAGVTGLLVGVAGLAAFLPAQRAVKVDPLVALRTE